MSKLNGSIERLAQALGDVVRESTSHYEAELNEVKDELLGEVRLVREEVQAVESRINDKSGGLSGS